MASELLREMLEMQGTSTPCPDGKCGHQLCDWQRRALGALTMTEIAQRELLRDLANASGAPRDLFARKQRTDDEVREACKRLADTCSCTVPHSAHTFGGRPMRLCKGIPSPHCDGKVTLPSGQCLMCKAYHAEAK